MGDHSVDKEKLNIESESFKSLSEWQNIVDFITRISGVRAGLLMHVIDDEIEVLVSSNTENNPYKPGDREHLYGSGLYCEEVIKTQEMLLIPNALKSKAWNHNPDLKHKLIAYMGLPIKNPSGKPFGTLCLLNDKATGFPEDLQELMKNMVHLIEGNLKLENANLELEGFFNVSLDLLCISDFNGNFIRLNKAWSEILGYPLEAIEGKPFLDFVHPDDIQETLSVMDKLNKQENVINFINRYIASDGTYKHIEWRTHPTEKLVYASARDISERIEIENKLININEQFELAIRGSNDGIWDWNIRTNALYISPKWKDQLGYRDDEVPNRYESFENLIHLDDKPMINEKIQIFMNDANATYDIEFRMRHKSGEFRWIRAKGAALRDENGKAIRMAGSHTDITNQRKAEDALTKSEAMYRILTETISDVIWVLNMENMKFVYLSPSIFQLRGYSVEEALKQRIEDTMTPDSLELMLKDSKQLMDIFINNPNQPVVYTYEVRQTCKDGRLIWVEISSRFRYNSEREIELVGISRNIDDRKRAQEEILYLSYHDQLTGLYNRRYYEEELKRLDTSRNYPLTLVMADLNNMKFMNDTYGHKVGDDLLICFGGLLKEELREDDIVARIGGDEFVILLPKTDCQMATILIERIIEMMDHTFISGIALSAAFGCHTKISKEETLDSIFRNAENHMYTHKKAMKECKHSEDVTQK